MQVLQSTEAVQPEAVQPEAVQPDELLADELPADYDVNPREWGIFNNCIRTNRIHKISFIDQQSALIRVRGKKFILMTLSRPCHGVKRNAISYESRNGVLCARFDSIKVLDDFQDISRGISCQIKSFEPYLLPLGEDDLPLEASVDNDS